LIFTVQPEAIALRTPDEATPTKVSALGMEEQQVNVIGDFVDSARSLGDAYRVDTQIVIWQGKNILKTPMSSLFRCHQSAWCVFVVERGRADQREITIGHRSDREAEVLQGLQAGAVVILHPTENIKEGVRVNSR
jgi:HlyD family secretion protein